MILKKVQAFAQINRKGGTKMVCKKFKTFAQVVGFVTIGLLALLGVLGLAKGSSPVLAAVGLAPAAPQAATVPEVMNYQGILKDADGNPLNGTHTMTFRIYDEPEGGNNLWEETHADVTVRDGHFNVLLGYSVPLSATLFSSPDRYIGVTVDPHDEMHPRQRFATVPYAFHANRAFGLSAADGDPLDAVTVDDDGNLGNTSIAGDLGISGKTTIGGNVGIGTTSPGAPLHVVGGSDASLSGGGYFVAGSTSSRNLVIDNNEIMARNNGYTSTLYLNKDGGEVHIGDNVGIVGDGNDGTNAALKIQSPGQVMLLDGNEIDSNGTLYLNKNSEKDIKWGGHLGSMELSGEYHLVAHNGWAEMDLRSAENSICFLVGVAFNDVDDSDEWVKCCVDIDGGRWKLKAYESDDDNDAWCEARCLSW